MENFIFKKIRRVYIKLKGNLINYKSQKKITSYSILFYFFYVFVFVSLNYICLFCNSFEFAVKNKNIKKII